VALRIDGLNHAEARALAAYEQAGLLADLLLEVGQLGAARKETRGKVRDARIAVLRATDSRTRDDAKVALLEAQAMSDVLKIEYDYRKEQSHMLESLLKSVPG
jgi:hypothetical protein